MTEFYLFIIYLFKLWGFFFLLLREWSSLEKRKKTHQNCSCFPQHTLFGASLHRPTAFDQKLEESPASFRVPVICSIIGLKLAVLIYFHTVVVEQHRFSAVLRLRDNLAGLCENSVHVPETCWSISSAARLPHGNKCSLQIHFLPWRSKCLSCNSFSWAYKRKRASWFSLGSRCSAC